MVDNDLLKAFYKLKKHCEAKVLQGIWERFLYENNRNYDSYKLSYKFTFIPFLSIHRNRKQDSNIQQVGGLVTRNSFAFCLKRVALYLKGVLNSIGGEAEGFTNISKKIP